jgi:hypothetical protein
MQDLFDTSGEGVIDGVGVTVHEMQEIARRQLFGSIVAGILVASVASLVALHPSPPETALKSTHTISLVRHSAEIDAPSLDLAAAAIERSGRP